MTHRVTLVAALSLALLTFLPASWAEPTTPADSTSVKAVAEHLFVFEQQAAQVSDDAGELWTLVRNHDTARGSHAYYLNNLREDINNMGEVLAELEYMKPQATEAQKLAIERVRPHLVALAQKTSEALDLAREGSRNLTHLSYKETLENLYEQAEALYQTLDAIGEYHDASEHFDTLESSHDGAVS